MHTSDKPRRLSGNMQLREHLMIRYYYRLLKLEVVIFVQYKEQWNHKVQNADLIHKLAMSW
jgi:hypothetical protein